jgi:7,8-dihydropterin-6-yl-methyl-4-(beta-D-ribofuranosyl)aminobenzene 5'-phosphate synthase
MLWHLICERKQNMVNPQSGREFRYSVSRLIAFHSGLKPGLWMLRSALWETPMTCDRLARRLTFLLFLLCCGVGQGRAADAPAAGMRITNLYDAFGVASEGLTKDFGFSALVEYRGKTVLFDAGTDARIFERNLQRMKVDARKIDVVVISHGHYDHIGGLDYIVRANPQVKIYLPNDFFALGAPTKFPFREAEPEVAKSLPKEQQYFGGERVIDGMVTVPTGLFWHSNVEYVTEAKEVLPGVMLIPTTSALMGTFIKYPPFGDEHPQFIGMPELSVSFATEKGQVLLVGCSHSSIDAILQQTRKIRNAPVLLVAGGFHLITYNRTYIDQLATRMRDEYGVQNVAPAHCTGHVACAIFRATFGEHYRFFGLGETLRL